MKPITILVIALFAAMLFTDVDVSAQEMPDSLVVSPAVNADTDSVPPMTLAVSPDSVAAQEKPHSSTLWIKQLLDNGFLIKTRCRLSQISTVSRQSLQLGRQGFQLL